MFALVDCNSFYASCHQIFRTDLRHKPVAVLSNSDGFVIARSKEAKALGIGDLQPFFKIEKLLHQHNVAIFSANFPLYGDISGRVMRTLKHFSPNTEVYSIDEIFLSFNGMHNDFNLYGQEIKSRVFQHIGMPVCVGVAPTKTLSKLANRVAKKKPQCNGVCVLDEAYKWEWVLKRIAVTDVWGVGKRIGLRLADLGIQTAYDLATSDPRRVRRRCSVMVERTISELNGIPCFALEELPPAKKQIYCTRSLAEKARTIEPILEALSVYSARAAEKLRQQKCLVKKVHVFMHTSPFKPNYFSASDSITLLYPTDDTRVITGAVRKLAHLLYRSGHEYMKAGIGFIDVIDKKHNQSDLFHPGQPARADDLMHIMDKINGREGKGTVFLAAQGVSQPFAMRQNFPSPQYTTKWSDIPVVINRS